MFKKLEARLCFAFARQDYVLNGDGQAQAGGLQTLDMSQD